MAEEIAFENGRISNFVGLVTVTLTLDRVMLHTFVYHSSTSTHMSNFIEVEELQFPSNTVWDKRREASVSKTSSICSAVFLQCRFVMEMGWFRVARGHPRPLELLPLDRVHTSSY